MNKKTVPIILISIPIIIIAALIIYICLNNYYKHSYNYYSEYKGKYEYVDANEKFVIERYFNQIVKMLDESNISDIQSIINENDKKYYIMGSR